MGVWSRVERFDVAEGEAGWSLTEDGRVAFSGKPVGELHLPMPGRYNALNALAAVAAARDVGVAPETALEILAHFAGVKRRQEVKGRAYGCVVIDDFAHHPTAVRETIAAVREGMVRRGCQGPPHRASRTPQQHDEVGHDEGCPGGVLEAADRVFCYAGPSVRWAPEEALAPLWARRRPSRTTSTIWSRGWRRRPNPATCSSA